MRWQINAAYEKSKIKLKEQISPVLVLSNFKNGR
jgi:hypothetical protein